MRKLIGAYQDKQITKAELIRAIYTRIASKVEDYTKVIADTRKELLGQDIKVRYSELYSATKDMWEPA